MVSLNRFCCCWRRLLAAVAHTGPMEHVQAHAETESDAAVASGLLKVSVPSSPPPQILRALRLLAEQSTRGIDYKSLGLGWDHPTARTTYHSSRHPSMTHPKSKARSEASRAALVELVKAAKGGDKSAMTDLEGALVKAFVKEVGLSPDTEPGSLAQFGPVLEALEAELLLPLRALVEGQPDLCRTFNGVPLPKEKMEAKALEIVQHVLVGDFSEWRYNNPLGLRQLEGLSDAQRSKWAEATLTEHKGGITVHEDSEGELGFFWATKIGGPSHGFDIEGQCLMPLLANARHKVILVSDPGWTYHPVGRAHFRLLWTATTPPEPLLWLETVNKDFVANVNSSRWQMMVLNHAINKAEDMGVRLSVQPGARQALESLLGQREQQGGEVTTVSERLVLRPSNAVVEASDYLSPEHDWHQEHEEITEPIRRCVYIPPAALKDARDAVDEAGIKKRKVAS
eukprot:TRINITY_DN28784_c0_g3_i3.p1 TRINITY_DN28784_c0_g3~~TRINITY_DN28784_c0_g3_i3.p1  ORF type:complete len:455 (+),score=101.41 TRINITY_DN28784_c0_g3_i3:36-1400(+)